MSKKDLRGAFTLLFFDADDVQNLTISNDRWTGTPAAFQVATRAVIHELILILQGTPLMYSDDILVVTSKKDATTDMCITDKVCSDLMGPDSIEQTKTEPGRLLIWTNNCHNFETKNTASNVWVS
jgi:hypothetical protein